jgi:hypothetical protein
LALKSECNHLEYLNNQHRERIAVVVGTVTDDQRVLDCPKLTIAALRFTETARARIIKAGGKCLTLDQLVQLAPTGMLLLLLFLYIIIKALTPSSLEETKTEKPRSTSDPPPAPRDLTPSPSPEASPPREEENCDQTFSNHFSSTCIFLYYYIYLPCSPFIHYFLLTQSINHSSKLINHKFLKY